MIAEEIKTFLFTIHLTKEQVINESLKRNVSVKQIIENTVIEEVESFALINNVNINRDNSLVFLRGLDLSTWKYRDFHNDKFEYKITL